VSDRYQTFANSPVGRMVVGRVGLPTPVKLDRYEPGQPVITGPVLLGGSASGRLLGQVATILGWIGADAYTLPEDHLRTAAADAGLAAKIFNPDAAGDTRFKALVFDASGVSSCAQLAELHAFFSPTAFRMLPSGRVIVLGTPPEDCESAEQRIAQRALEGLTRSLGKEVKRGTTSQLVYVAPDAEEQIESTLRFFLSPKSAYVSAQVVRIGAADSPDGIDWELPLQGKVALVTGASRGIGEAIADTLARDGAHVVGLDVPALEDDLRAVAQRIGGSTLTLDITAPDAPRAIGDHLQAEHGGVDVLVHNAGITRDKTIGRMTAEQWSQVLEVNLCSEIRINDELLRRDLVRANGRIVCVSSISGIAGNMGQTNYATSKAGVIGMVDALAPVVAEHKATINAVAPGFIETQMTAKVPIALREAGRRMNSMSQGGLPIDVAETIAWFASPGSAGVNGNVVRVCGQSLLGR
jgi:3-oxoacyl-[acyl-carrier protein] reductase